MTTATDWRQRVGDIWAAEWRRTDRSLADLSRHLDSAILSVAQTATTVLDIGCGAGATSAALAAARPDCAITGVDLSAPLVALARERVPGATFHVADAAAGEAGQGPFDLLVSRHGVMFFVDPAAAFTRLHALAASGARLVFSCFRERATNAFAGELVAELTGTPPVDPPPYMPGPFAFASHAWTTATLTQAGWREVAATRVDFDYVAGEGADPVADAVSFLSRIGPLASVVAADPDHVAPRLAGALARYVTGPRVILPASAWIWRATKEPS